MLNSDSALSDDTDVYASVDVLASDFIARYRSGDRPTVEEYADRHPELRETIRSIFPLVLSVEKVKVDQQTEQDGSATLAGRQIERLGDFRIVRQVGRGGMGIVYEAIQESLGRTVAIKVLPKQSLLDDDALERFRREARTAAAMHHSNIVPIFGTGETDGTHYLVMQLVRGESLDKRIASVDANRLGIHESAGITRQVADALAYSHRSGVLHRDIKPANVLIDETGTAQVTDFGLARSKSDDPTMTQALSGSPRYMAPERFIGQSDARADIYALGLTLYEMVAGVPAFTESDPHQLMDAVRQHRIKPLTSLRDSVPIDLATIVNKTISPEPAHRYQTAAELRDDLDRFLADEPILARRTSLLARVVRWCRRNPKMASAVSVAAASLLLATIASTGGWMLTSAANRRTSDALRQSEQTVDLALQSLDGVVDMVSVPATNLGEIGFDDSAATTLTINPSPHTAQVLENIQPLYERLSQQSPTRPDIVEQMIGATIRLAMIQRQLGQTTAAVESLQTGINTLATRAETASLPNKQKQLLSARLHNELGDAYAVELQLDQSDAAYLSAIRAAEGLPATSTEGMLQRARAHVALGSPLPPRQRMQRQAETSPDEQRKHLSDADALLEVLHESHQKSSQIASLRAQSRMAQSRLEKRPFLKRNFVLGAIAILQKQLEVAPKDTAVRYTLVEALAAVSLRREGKARGVRFEATSRLTEALAELSVLEQQVPETPVFQASEVRIRHKLANIARAEAEYDDARAQLHTAIEIQSNLVAASPDNWSHRCWRALLYRSLAEVEQVTGNKDSKRDAVVLASEDMQAILPHDREQPFVQQTQKIVDALSKDAL